MKKNKSLISVLVLLSSLLMMPVSIHAEGGGSGNGAGLTNASPYSECGN